MVVCLERGADLHMAQLMPLPLSLASVKSRLVLPSWYRLTRVVPEKGPLNGCVCVCVFHFPASKKNKVKDQLVAKLKWKETEGRTRPIALRRSSPLTPSIKVNHIVDFNKARSVVVTVSDVRP